MRVGLTALVASILWSLSWTTRTALLGEKPTAVFSESSDGGAEIHGAAKHGQAPLENATDPEIEKLRKEIDSAKGDVKKLSSIAGDLVTRYRGLSSPSNTVAFELVNAFGAILKADPKNASALVGMADVSFDQQTFSKAVEFYERYLKIVPGEDKIRERYAASLTFVGRVKDSIAELDRLVKKDPKNFGALAYLAVAYSQDGQKDKAVEIGVKALPLAPSDEARQRFGAFLNELKGEAPAPDAANVRGNVPSTAVDASKTEAVKKGVEGVEFAIKQSPVAGSKFSKSERKDDGTLVLYFHNFPMGEMPPFARDKFLGKVREAGTGSPEIRKISFVDEATGKEMETLILGANQ